MLRTCAYVVFEGAPRDVLVWQDRGGSRTDPLRYEANLKLSSGLLATHPPTHPPTLLIPEGVWRVNVAFWRLLHGCVDL